MSLDKYIDQFGFVRIKPNDDNPWGDGNGLLQTGLAIACGMLNPSYELQFNLLLCRKDVWCPLIYRSPNKKNNDDNQGPDDYYGAFLFGDILPGLVLEYAEAKNWHFDIQQPDKPRPEYNFNRFPAFVPCLRIAAGKRLSLAETVVLFGSIVVDSFDLNKADGNMKAFCRIVLAERYSKLFTIAGALWRYQVRRKYKSIGRSWSDYFKEGHPLNDYN
tara:strand:+ start:793 stop:1443 length:651 start_codon:yes stop_codon:yes gene_type:complete